MLDRKLRLLAFSVILLVLLAGLQQASRAHHLSGPLEIPVDAEGGVARPVAVAVAELVAIDERPEDAGRELVVANHDRDLVSILYNRMMAFSLHEELAVANGPAAVVAADLSCDEAEYVGEAVCDGLHSFGDLDCDGVPESFRCVGKADIATASDLEGSVSVLLNVSAGGDPDFDPAVEVIVRAGTALTSLVAVDLDGDSDPDLAATNRGDNEVAILRNDGGGTFTMDPSDAVTVGDSPASLAAADLDCSRRIAVGCQDCDDPVEDMNGDGIKDCDEPDLDGDGTLDPVEDLDGDGVRDCEEPDLDGDGVFDRGSLRWVCDEALEGHDLRAGDLNCDGIVESLECDGRALDLVVANRGSDTVSVLLNDGTGTFTRTDYGPDLNGDGAADISDPTSVAVGDLGPDRDGILDIVVANRDDDSITILRGEDLDLDGRGDGTFGNPLVLTVRDEPVAVQALPPFDDILVVHERGGPPLNGELQLVFLECDDAGACTYGPNEIYPSPGEDRNLDGDLDTGEDLNGDCLWSKGEVDLDGDGWLDTEDRNCNHDLDREDWFDGPVFVAAGDVEPDGDADVVVVNKLADTVSVLTNTLTSPAEPDHRDGSDGAGRLMDCCPEGGFFPEFCWAVFLGALDCGCGGPDCGDLLNLMDFGAQIEQVIQFQDFAQLEEAVQHLRELAQRAPLGHGVVAPLLANVRAEIDSLEGAVDVARFELPWAHRLFNAWDLDSRTHGLEVPATVPAGSNVTVSLGGGITISFDGVMESGSVTPRFRPLLEAAPTGYHTPLPNYSVDLDGSVVPASGTLMTVVMDYSAATFRPGAEVRMFHEESGVLVDRTMFSNPTSRLVAARVGSLGRFVLFGTGAVTSISCPPDVTLTCPADTSTGFTGSATASGNGGPITIEHVDRAQPAGPGSGAGTITRTWSAFDGFSGLRCRQSIEVVDGVPPVLSCPAPMTVEACVPTGGLVSVSVPPAGAADGCDFTPIIANSRTLNGPDASGFYPEGTTAVAFTAVDASGNTAICSTTVTVVDTNSVSACGGSQPRKPPLMREGASSQLP